jgi:beta-N-acetylhexosaminidase
MSLQQKIGQMLMAGVTGTTADDARAMIEDLHVGNVILMGRNVENPEQVRALTGGLQELAMASNGIGAIIATDQEGGLVQRLHYVAGFTALPMAATVGEARCPERVRAYGAMAGAEMAAVGVNMDMAPVLDVNTNPDNPVIGALGRSFGATSELVEMGAVPFMLGLHDAGVMSTGKHFPGHGATTTDSHLDLPYVDEPRATLEAVDMAPFRTAIAYGLDALMPAHVVYPARCRWQSGHYIATHPDRLTARRARLRRAHHHR